MPRTSLAELVKAHMPSNPPLREVLALLGALLAGEKWDRMGSAPRDGSSFLALQIFGKTKTYRVVQWPEGYPMGAWEKMGGKWYGCPINNFHPTWWRHVPDGPRDRRIE